MALITKTQRASGASEIKELVDAVKNDTTLLNLKGPAELGDSQKERLAGFLAALWERNPERVSVNPNGINWARANTIVPYANESASLLEFKGGVLGLRMLVLRENKDSPGPRFADADRTEIRLSLTPAEFSELMVNVLDAERILRSVKPHSINDDIGIKELMKEIGKLGKYGGGVKVAVPVPEERAGNARTTERTVARTWKPDARLSEQPPMSRTFRASVEEAEGRASKAEKAESPEAKKTAGLKAKPAGEWAAGARLDAQTRMSRTFRATVEEAERPVSVEGKTEPGQMKAGLVSKPAGVSRESVPEINYETAIAGARKAFEARVKNIKLDADAEAANLADAEKRMVILKREAAKAMVEEEARYRYGKGKGGTENLFGAEGRLAQAGSEEAGPDLYARRLEVLAKILETDADFIKRILTVYGTGGEGHERLVKEMDKIGKLNAAERK